MKKLPKISEAEYEVMKIVWAHAPISTSQVVEQLTPTSSWSPKTIQTMLLRLVKKGALANEKEGRVFIYTPLVREDEYRARASRKFLDRFYGGDLNSMILNFVKEEQLSSKEIEELKNILDQRGKNK